MYERTPNMARATVTTNLMPGVAAALRRLGNGSTSAGARLAIVAGLVAIQESDLPADPVALQADLAAAAGGLLPSGARWCGDEPPTEPAVIVQGGGNVLLLGESSALILTDQNPEGHALLVDGGQGPVMSTVLSLTAHAHLVAALQAGMLALHAEGGPSERALAHRLVLRRLENGYAQIVAGTVAVTANAGLLWQFAAELAGALAWRIRQCADDRLRLEHSLAASPEAVEASA